MPGQVDLGGKLLIAWPGRGQRIEGPRERNVEEGNVEPATTF